jgi:coatomer subunit beta'
VEWLLTQLTFREYIIYTALAWRNKAFGQALDFVWASKENSNDFAIRESPTSVKVYKNFVEKPGGLDVGFQADGLTGGVLLGVKGQGGISFFDWQSGALVRRIEVDPKQARLRALVAGIRQLTRK